MPELPEVETIRSQLENKIKGKIIKNIKVIDPRMINLPPKKFIFQIKGARIKHIRRRAKLLIIDLSNNYSLLIHLKLSGFLIYNQEPDKYTNVVFEFNNNKKLLYKDFRKFGYMKLLKTSAIDKIEKKFGPEPLDKNFTLEKFKKILQKRKRAKIKPLLMNQEFLAGIGNIYSQEACFYAKVDPARKVGTLNDNEIKNIYNGLKKIMSQAIKVRGASIDTYRDTAGQKGDFGTKLKVYGRVGQKCFRCGGKIKAIKLSGRTTYFCPKCQK